MNSSTDFKKYGGNGALYLTIGKYRQGTFLRRNIKQALDQHHQALHTSQSGTDDGMYQDASGKAWSLPDNATMAALREKNKPVLKVDVKYLFPNDPKGTNSNLAQSKIKTRKWAAQCRLIFRVYHTTRQRPGSDKALEDLYTENVNGWLQAWRNNTTGEEFVSVTLDKPVCFTTDQLKIQTPVSQGKAYRSLMGNSYHMTIHMEFPHDREEYMQDRDDRFILPFLDAERNSLPKKAGKIHAKMTTLIQSESEASRCPLHFTTGGKSYPLAYDMAVHAGWEVPRETPMQYYNRTLRCVRGEQLLSPISEPSTPAGIARLAYWFKDQVRPKATSVEGFLCLFCRGRDLHSLDRLHHHFKTEHDMFTFKIRKVGSDAPACLQCDFKIEVDISDKYSDCRASHSGADSREFQWVAPLKPFDLKAYLKGDESWITDGLGLKKKLSLAHRIPPLPQGAVEPKKPTEVPDMPRVEKKRHRVPKAPKGLRFYRTDSKRLLVEGEYLSESDDEISEDWLKLRRNLATKDTGVPTAAKLFMMKWDDYMQDEQLSGDTHVGDAVVRFGRKYRFWLRTQERMGNEFLRKTSELHSDSIICTEVFRACVDLIEGDGSMMDALAVSAEIKRHQSTPIAPETNGTSSRQSDPKMKRKYIPGGPGGGGKWFDVVDDDKKRKSKKARPTINRENSQHSSQMSVSSLPTPQNTDGEFIWAGLESSTKPPLPEETSQQPTMAVQSGCTCGRVVDDDFEAISCANLVSYMI